MEQIISDIYNQIPSIWPIVIMWYLAYFQNQVNKQFSKANVNILRLRLLNLIQHNPNQTSIIQKLYTEYKTLWWNCEIDDMYKEWKKNYKN